MSIAVIHGEAQKDIEETLKHDGRQSPPLEASNENTLNETNSIYETETAVERTRPSSSSSSNLGLSSTSYELYPTMVVLLFRTKL